MYRNVIVILVVFVVESAIGCSHNTWFPYGGHHVAALILARGGSKGIPLKNLSVINGRTLINITLSTILQVPQFKSIWVSTDHLEIAKEASHVNVHWRSSESATDTSPSIAGVLDFVQNHGEIDSVALIQCTSPFIRPWYLISAFQALERNECVFSASRSFKLRWSDYSLRPLNFNLSRRPRRQDWNGELVENGMFYFAKRSLIIKGHLQSERWVGYLLKEPNEVIESLEVT